MNCPVCNAELRMAERQGVEIDYCVKCRGVWLDRGELDKIIKRSVDWDDNHYREREHQVARPDHGQDGYPYNKRNRRSRLGELFDFFD